MQLNEEQFLQLSSCAKSLSENYLTTVKYGDYVGCLRKFTRNERDKSAASSGVNKLSPLKSVATLSENLVVKHFWRFFLRFSLQTPKCFRNFVDVF